MAVRESQASIPASLADTEAQRITKGNTRFSSQYLVDFLEKDVPNKREPFLRPLDKAIITGNFEGPKKAPKEQLDLSNLMAMNRGQ